jgi:hypothetical protein
VIYIFTRRGVVSTVIRGVDPSEMKDRSPPRMRVERDPDVVNTILEHTLRSLNHQQRIKPSEIKSYQK